MQNYDQPSTMVPNTQENRPPAIKGAAKMDGIEVLQDAFSRIHSTFLSTLRGLAPEDLYYSPNIECNTIAWLAWHLTRVQDRHIADLAEHEQEWILGKWFEEFGQSPAPANVGFGHTPEQVQNFTLPNLDLMLAYHDAVYFQSASYLKTITPTDLDRILDEPQYDPLPTIGVRLVSVISDNSQHVGQMAYLRGLIQGRSW